MKHIAVLGSTGSIGTQTLDIIERFPDQFQVTVLAAGKNIALLEQQIRKFQPEMVAVFDEAAAKELALRVSDLSVPVYSGLSGMEKVAAYEKTDVVVTSLVGAIGILPTLAAIERGKTIALANKETLVAAGKIVTDLARAKGVTILPIDSEHSAIFQALRAGKRAELKKILLTASGGPFFSSTLADLEQVTPSQALKHPNWAMGGKITIDSATMMNKGLEVIEARWLFDVTPEQIQVVIHPQSIVHSMVEFVDTTVIAQMGLPDMRVPIQYALTYPERWDNQFAALDFFAVREMTFLEPDFEKFPALAYAYQALQAGGTSPAVLNAANEVAVYAFLRREIGFLQIAAVVKQVLDQHQILSNPAIEDILCADRWAREQAKKWIEKIN